MVGVITTALVGTLIQYMFEKSLDQMDEVAIGGAPSWYMEDTDDKMCTFSHTQGGIDFIDATKVKAKNKMLTKINDLIEVTIYDNKKLIKNNQDFQLVKMFKNDPFLDGFVKKNLHYPKVVFEDEINTTFVKSCIKKNVIIEYQTQRIQKIKAKLTTHKANKAFDELDAALK